VATKSKELPGLMTCDCGDSVRLKSGSIDGSTSPPGSSLGSSTGGPVATTSTATCVVAACESVEAREIAYTSSVAYACATNSLGARSTTRPLPKSIVAGSGMPFSSRLRLRAWKICPVATSTRLTQSAVVGP